MSQLVHTLPKVYTATGITNSSGIVTFSIPSNTFNALTSVNASVQRNTSLATEYSTCYVKTSSISSVVVQVVESKTTNTLLISTAEGLESSGSGITVNLLVTGS